MVWYVYGLPVRGRSVPFTVWCNIEGCPFEETEVSTVEEAFDLHDAHTVQFGDLHALEFERISVAVEVNDD